MRSRWGVEGEARGRQLALLIGVSWWRGERIDAALGDEALSLLVEGSPRWCNCVVELAVDSWRAADRARLRSFASRLLDAVASIPRGDRGDEDVVAAVLRLGVLGELAAEPDLGGRAWELVGGREDLSPANLGRLHRLESERARREGDLGEALRAARSARRVARELGDSRAALVESSYVVRVLSEVGAFAEVEVEVGAAVAECTGLGLEALGAAFLLYRGVARVATGAVLEGRAEIESAVRTFARVGDPRMLATARLHLAIAHLRGGDAASAAREALAAAAGEPLGASDRAWAEAVLADARRAEGDVDAALAHASSAARIAQAQAGIEAEVGTAALLALARAQLAGARAEAARSTLADAQRWLTTRAARIHEPDLRRSFLHAVPVHAEILGLADRLSGEAPSDGRS